MSEERHWYLTTSDNPWNYFDNYERWEEHDRLNGYNTNATIARVAGPYNPELPDEIIDEEWTNAMERILDWHLPFVNSEGETVHYTKCYE